MIRLDTTTRSLQALLAGAITTNQLPVTVGYSDGTSAVYTGAAQLTPTNSTTAVTICSAPAAGVVRDVDYIAISNTDTAAATVTVRVNDSGTFYDQVKVTLQVGRQLVYTHASGWNVGPTDTTPLPANPSASIGLTAVNGSAATFMRSDAAPALSQSITPTWTGAHIFSSTVALNGGVTLGDASGDALTINSNTASIPNGLNLSGGKLGIGRTPSTILDVQAAGAAQLRIRGGSGTDQGAAYFVTQGGSDSSMLAIGDAGGIVGGAPNTTAMVWVGNFPLATVVNGAERLRVATNGDYTPGADNVQTFGSGALRWSVIYAGTGTINTSDARKKRPFP